MRKMLRACGPICGEISVPGDKSISHRAVLLGAIADGITKINGFSSSDDCRSTITCVEKLGVKVQTVGENMITVCGVGVDGLKKPGSTLWVGNSGTTIRLLAGILAGQAFSSVLDGDKSVRMRPMSRIIAPLSAMGAYLESHGGMCPLRISGGGLVGINYTLPIASAQLKSCVLLAGLFADGETRVTELRRSRDHTERMLRRFGAAIAEEMLPAGKAITLSRSRLTPCQISVPGDISSAAFFIVAALIVPGSRLTVRGVGINSTRAGMLDVFRAMGADITVNLCANCDDEPTADITAAYSSLHGTEIGAELIPTLIDEIPAIAVAAAAAEGKTVIRGAGELRVKESDRLTAISCELAKAGADVTEMADGLAINGGKALRASEFDSHGDHRIAMMCAVAALTIDEASYIDGAETVGVSYPNFFETLLGFAKNSERSV